MPRAEGKGGMMGSGMMIGKMGFLMLLNLLFWVLIIIGIILVITWAVSKSKGARGKPQEESVLDILKKRYARGEISREEFEEKKRELL